MASTQPTQPNADLKSQYGVTWVGLVINLVLGTVKTATGVLGRSSAIIADGLHSFSDLASDLAVLWGLRASSVPPDSDHHYGHARYETVVTLVVGALLVLTAAYIAGHAILTLGDTHNLSGSWWPFWAAVGSIVLKEVLFWVTRAVGRRTRSTALTANAWHHRTDSFSSVAAAIGIGASLVLGPRWAFLDHLTAVVLAAFLVVVGVRIIRNALHDLADRAPDERVQQRMRETITGIEGVDGYHAFRARKTGGLVEMDVHIQVRSDLTVEQGHDIATRVEEAVCGEFPEVATVVVHVEPER